MTNEIVRDFKEGCINIWEILFFFFNESSFQNLLLTSKEFGFSYSESSTPAQDCSNLAKPSQ